MRFETRVAWRYVHGDERRRGRQLGAAIAVAVAVAGGALMTVGGTAETIGAVVAVVGVLAATVLGLLALFSVFTSVSVLGVAIGVAALTVVLAVMTGFQDEFRDRVLAGRAHVSVVSTEGGFADYEAVLARAVAVDPDIIGAEPFVYAELLVTRGRGQLSGVVLKGIDPARVGSVFPLARQLTSGSLGALSTPRAAGVWPPVLIGVQLAAKLHATLGDRLTIVMPLPPVELGPAPRTRVFQIAGIFDSGFEQYDRRFIYASLRDTQALVDAAGRVTGIELRLRDPDRAAAVARELEAALGEPFSAQDWYSSNENLFTALAVQKLVLLIILTMIIAVAAFNLVSALTMLVTDKTREIAILESMGASSRSIGRLFRTVGLAIGAVGTTVGIAVGLVLCRIVAAYGYRLDAQVYMIDRLPVAVHPREVALVAVITLAISVAATIVPARAAAALTPVDGLRYDRARPRSS